MQEVDPNTLYPDVLGGFKSTPPEYVQNILDHVRMVARLVNRCAAELVERGTDHDRSKWTPEEYGPYERALPRFKEAEYGSPEYFEVVKSIKPAIKHHTSVNRHHPEFFGDQGVAGMNLLDVLEMCCDWIAAARREDPDKLPDIAYNAERFKIEPQLAAIIQNTITYLTQKEVPDGC